MNLRPTWKVALHRCGVEVVSLLKTLAVDMVECVEVNSAICGCEGKEGKKGVEELHCAYWCSSEPCLYWDWQ